MTILFSDLEPTPEVRRTAEARARVLQNPTGPCQGCPLVDVKPKIPPVIRTGAVLAVVSLGPSAGDEEAAVPISGRPGEMLVEALRAAGVDPTKVTLSLATRCRPVGDVYDCAAWESAARRCRAFFDADVPADVPLLLLGGTALRTFAGGRAKVGGSRGLWAKADGRTYFTVRDPAQILAVQDPAQSEALRAEFAADVARMADVLLGREPPLDLSFEVYGSPAEAAGYLATLAVRAEPWAFDIEAYDAAVFPSRRGVSTDPCHPDFRLRGVAVATSPREGAWIDCAGWEGRLVEARALFSPAFGSPAAKWAFNGHYDEEGLVYPGWVECVANRAGDGMLALLALSDGAHESLRLEHAVVNVLGARQYWNGMDKSRMRDVPLAVVAANAVGDACYTYQLVELLHGRLERGEYMNHERIG